MTDAGASSHLLAGLPGDPAGIARVVQGLLVHEFWAAAYGVSLAEPERDLVNLRRVEQVLDAVTRRDDRPLDVTREPHQRVATNCRGFTVMAVTLLRTAGVPARARCGFGAYFAPGWYEDHWVAEYHDGDRWKLLDAQVDELQRRQLGIDFDLTDVPRDEFVIAGDAWTMTRAGRADPDRFGLTSLHEAGAWWIAANLMRDAAALDGVELLPWDLWGGMPGPDDAIDVALFDELADATAGPSMADVRRLLADDRLRVPDEVFNVQHRRREVL
ncbi:transglutaminase-like domain-containing protein [Cellulomonas hominis]|uniref:transglutaminase-like domain-containing protein n=1 Tax=Cellulomonas hominis TaxID=156981 RepID=UPI001BD0F748|nr:transglutaminase-like domain-containing protein [Cellulomonas hominis]